MCKYCENPNKTIVRHLLGVYAFVGAGRLFLRFDDIRTNNAIIATEYIKFCPMCGRKFKEEK